MYDPSVVEAFLNIIQVKDYDIKYGELSFLGKYI